MTSPEVERLAILDKVGGPGSGPSGPSSGKRVTFGSLQPHPHHSHPNQHPNRHGHTSHQRFANQSGGGRRLSNVTAGSAPSTSSAITPTGAQDDSGAKKPPANAAATSAMKRPSNYPRQLRKRSYSFSEGHSKQSLLAAAPFINNAKRWKNVNKHNNAGLKRNHKNVLPSKFLLGGNIRDPLNLNSLSNEKMSKIMNAVTPESSPLPTPKHRKAEHKIEVLIPPNISDPLNLNAVVDENEYESKLISPNLAAMNEKRKKKFRYRKRARSTSSKASLIMANAREHESEPEHEIDCSLDARDDEDVLNQSDSAITQEPKAPILKRNPKEIEAPPPKSTSTKDEVASPVSPPPATRQFKGSKNNFQTAKNSTKASKVQQAQSKAQHKIVEPRVMGVNRFHQKNKKFEYGNYNRYYGYRAPNAEDDPRLKYLKAEWFAGKEVLDIGCNVGQLTMALGRLFHTKSIIGMDIDKGLIEVARKRLRHVASQTKASNTAPKHGESKDSKKSPQFPANLPQIFGPLDPASGLRFQQDSNSAEQYPRNVKFVCGNYVLENEELLQTVQPEFDVISCFSTTKWMHLNFGDEGLKRAFKRIFAQLRPGGLFVLEAQGLPSYRLKKKLTERIYENFQKIKLKPEQFSDYLIHQVGFSSGHNIAVPHHSSKGFQRPIQIFVKRASSSYHASSTATTPYSGPSPHIPPKRCYAPSLTPTYNKYTPLHSPSANLYKNPNRTPSAGATPQPGPSATPNSDDDKFSRPANPTLYLGGFTPHYSPGHTPTYSGYQQGLTPGYSGPSPEDNPAHRRPSQHSPVYTGPPPGLISNASTPGHTAEQSEDFLEPGYAPSQSGYTPSNPGTPSHIAGPSGFSPGPYSPGNATPKGGYRTPGTSSNSPNTRSATSPQIQQPEVSGNTTPHPGPSGTSPADQQKYLWYGDSSSGGNTPQSNYDPSTSPQVYPTHYPPIGEDTYSNPATPNSPAANGGPNSPIPGPSVSYSPTAQVQSHESRLSLSPAPPPSIQSPSPVGSVPSYSPRQGPESPT
ncbi:hypothetical protein TCAL_04624 [Tigriopus californicus]|uniref:RNA methyltransferase n=1 Tax=Tigriopus californicus TaxID=6832 RepID=A0A553NFU7_TIGCA|nr:7SK snRNA methylphosphate capping enzyme-like [Tigriopus californicus]TRY64317.1 hypothetical protein TCAL_04624 [Tigriopus californicus]|eukprot:TCALIF_04624-PA protein Name:"Similar to mepce 7SK snRNA methylphosphate capping enzyme (Danio rerio)" AED:0.01 eAED:0.01 QI:111/1/1/1/1/1/5/157/1027